MQSPFTRRVRRSSAWVIRVLLAALWCWGYAVHGWAAERQMLHGHVPPAAARLAAVGRLPGTQHLKLAIALPLRNQEKLAALLREIYDPGSLRFRRYLTAAEFTAEFGPTTQDYESVAAFAKEHGLTVTDRYSNRVVLDVDGAVSDIENALHVTLRVYRHPTEGRTFYAPDTEPALDLAVAVSHIEGLDNYSLPQPRVHIMPAGVTRPNVGSGPTGAYLGNDFRAAYVPGVSLTGTGETVGLVQFDGYSQSDITYYEGLAGLPNVKLTKVLLPGFNGRPSGGNGQIEVSLDIEMVMSMAPGVANIILYEAGPSGSWHDILNRMASDNVAKQLSCSWFSAGEAADPVADGIFQEMAAQGQSFYCASGDSDAYTGLIPFPEDTPYITEVGGTTLTVTGTGGPWSSEQVWNWGGGVGSGGGISTQYAIPAWQQGLSMTGNGGSRAMRNTPDVSLTADNIYVRAKGTDNFVGGTSCAAPLWGGLTALVNEQAAENGRGAVGFINPAVYALGSSSSYGAVFHDISNGNNISPTSPNAFYATTGYDLCTGLGTPNGAALINALAQPADSLGVSFASLISAGGVGGPFSPNTCSFILTNGGSSPLNWSASATQGWLSLSATGGTLAASGSTTVTASINANGNALASGTYSDTISFRDLGTSYAQIRPVSLSIAALPPPPVITSALTATVTNGVGFSYQIAATNNPSGYGELGLPAGLTLNNTTGLVSGTTTATGTSNVLIDATNAGGTGNALLTVVVGTPYAAWQSEFFTQAQLANPAISGDAATPAGDGVPNLLKYALNLNPWTDEVSGLPVGSMVTTGGGGYLTLTYTQVLSATDVAYTVQVSTDLQTWNSGPGYTTTPSATNNPDGVTQSVTMQSTTAVSGSAPNQFIRLQVTGP